MKKYFSLVLVCCLWLSFRAMAQSDTLLLRHEIGADFLPLLRQQHTGSLLYRRHQANSAFRVRFQASFLQHHTSAGNGSDPFSRHGAGTLRVGKQWGVSSGKMRFYYGLDGMATFAYSHNSVQLPEWYERTTHTIALGVLPLAGFGYNFNQRFGLSAEANGALTGSRDWIEARGFVHAGPNGRTSFVGFQLLSEYGLFLTYRF